MEEPPAKKSRTGDEEAVVILCGGDGTRVRLAVEAARKSKVIARQLDDCPEEESAYLHPLFLFLFSFPLVV